jgi:RNA polymerase sigma factor (sigma-70 family)
MALTRSNPPERSDDDLLAAIHRSPQERDRAMDYLWHDRSLRNMVFAALLKMLGDKDKAEEIFDEGLLQAMLKVLNGQFRHESTLRTYIVGICINLGKKAASRPPKHAERERSLPTENLEQLSSETADSPEQNYLDSEQERNLEQLFRRLYRQLPAYCEKNFRWFYSDDYSIADIAAAEQMQEQSIKNRLSECRKKLRQIIERDPEAAKIIAP